MKKSFFLIILTLNLTFFQSVADEGMWLPILLQKYNIADMQAKGFKLTAEDIYDVNNASMKDAVMIFGGGCTAELISNQGLIITNHHCGYGEIVDHSSVENDYLTNGFWAMSKEEELSNPGLTVTFLVYMEDVTTQILKNVTDEMTSVERSKIIEENITEVKNAAIKKSDDKYDAYVESFFYGNQYYLFVEQTFKDIRLVGAPPSAIGKFGGDTDNWMWPRHTGDFSLFRIYANQDNQPAEYSTENVPYTPKKYFPISLKGVQEGDFTMVFGYPGTTEEYLPSYAIEMKLLTENPHRIKIRDTKLDIINQAMNYDAETRIMYASKQSSIANGWKKWIGESRGLKKLDAVEKKQEFETKFQAWANSTPELKAKYGNVLSEYKEIYSQLAESEQAYIYFTEACYYLDPMKIARSVTSRIFEISIENNLEEIETTIETTKTVANLFFEDFDKEVDKKIFVKMLQLYYENMDKSYYPMIFDEIELNYSYDFEAYTDYLYENSILVNQDKLTEFLDSYSAINIAKIEMGGMFDVFGGFIGDILDTDFNSFKTEYILSSNKKLNEDPIYKLYRSFLTVYFNQVLPKFEELQPKLDELNRIYMKGQLEMQPDKIFYPDANSTLRVAYGKVSSYKPNDAVFYKHFTTLDGIIEKDNPEIYDYDVPDQLLELYKTKDYGQYADKDGKMHVGFIGTNHTTGGNSGSPVLNAEGQLIGINFDRAWESTMSDIMYDPDQCRNISLDIRYALFIIDKFAGATHLIDEMELVN
jgi:hypothetical protein